MSEILDAIRRAKAMMAELAPAPFLARSELFEPDRALTFTHDRRQHVGAHPLFWRKATGIDHVSTFVTTEPSWRLMDLMIHDLDADEARRDEFFGALTAVWDRSFVGPAPATSMAETSFRDSATLFRGRHGV